MIINTTSLPTRDRRFHGESTVIAGNSIALVIDASQVFNGYWKQSTSAINDSFTISMFLRAGTYTLSALGETTTSCGKIDWYLNNSIAITAQDWYSASLTRNVVKTGSITVTQDGYQIIKGIVSTKNGSSSGFDMFLTQLWMKQASD